MTWFRIDKDPCPLGKFLVLVNLPDESHHFDSCDKCKNYVTKDFITTCLLLKGSNFGNAYYSGEGKWGWLFLGVEEEIL